MRRTPIEIEKAILRLLLEGATYREIVHKLGVSLGKVNETAEDARKTMPDFDDLRTLSSMLRKYKLSVFDATRGCILLEALNKLGVRVQDLGDYVKLTERFLIENALEEDFIAYAIKLMQLEQVSGKTYQEIIEDFRAKHGQVEAFAMRETAMEKRIQVLGADCKKAEERLAKTESEIEQATSTNAGLAEIGIDRLAKLVKFIQEFESLGFDAHKLEKLACLSQELRKINLEPDTLSSFIAEKGPLEAQNSAIKVANERLINENTSLERCNGNLRRENSALSILSRAWRTRTCIVYCMSCGESMRIPFRSREYYGSLIDAGRFLRLWCPNCGPLPYDPREILLQIGWSLLPPNED